MFVLITAATEKDAKDGVYEIYGWYQTQKEAEVTAAVIVDMELKFSADVYRPAIKREKNGS